MTLHYPSLGGSFNVSMGRGQFLQAEPGVAKLLGVLSLQALPRRLLLDFRDVFSAGFTFDTIRGDVLIQQGIASTRNLQMKGVGIDGLNFNTPHFFAAKLKVLHHNVQCGNAQRRIL